MLGVLPIYELAFQSVFRISNIGSMALKLSKWQSLVQMLME
jgi:hypothetical protein